MMSSKRTATSLRMAAMLHDVGKVAISDAILKKPARLRRRGARDHEAAHHYGCTALFRAVSEFDDASAVVALNHHEKWDGTGYPGHINPFDAKVLPGYENSDGSPRPKKGDEIPVFGRLVALADVYDALSSKRAYKERWEEAQVLEELKVSSGTHFDPEMVETFFACIDTIRNIAERYPDQ